MTPLQILKTKLKVAKQLMRQHKEGFNKGWLGNNYLGHKREKERLEGLIEKHRNAKK